MIIDAVIGNSQSGDCHSLTRKKIRATFLKINHKKIVVKTGIFISLPSCFDKKLK